LNSVVGGNISSSIGAPTTVEDGTIDLGTASTTGTLRYTGPGETTDRVINLVGSGVIANEGTDPLNNGPLNFTSDFTATGSGVKTLTLTGANTDANTISGAIVDNSVSDTTALVKDGLGIWHLAGFNTYTGGTTVMNGTLTYDNSSAIAPGPITVTG